MVFTLICISAVMLFALILRFVQPQVLYTTSRVLGAVRANKATLDFQAGRRVASRELAAVLIRDSRTETEEASAVAARQRANKVRELYRVLDPRLGLPPKHENPSICIVELAELIRSLAMKMRPSLEHNRAVVASGSLLKHICGTVRRAEGYTRELADDDLGEWYIKNPVSMEQVVEILIATVEAISFRLKADEEAGPTLEKTYTALELITRLERRLRVMLRTTYLSATPVIAIEERLKAHLRSADYNQCTHRMELAHREADVYFDFVDFLSLRHLEQLVISDWELFKGIFPNQEWFTKRIERIADARGPLFHGQESEVDLELIKRFCNEIDERIWRTP